MERLSVFQKLVVFLAKKAGFKVDLSNKEIAKPEVPKKDAELIGHLEAKNAELQSKLKEKEKKQPQKQDVLSDNITSFFKPENEMPLGKIKYLQGVDGFIGDRLVNWYRIFRNGEEQIFFVVKVGKNLAYIGGRSLKESLKERNLDTNKPTLLVNFNRKGEYIAPEYLRVDLAPDINMHSSNVQALALVGSMAELLEQNSELKEQVMRVMPARLNELRKQYTEIMDSTLSDINKQKAELQKFLEEKKKLEEDFDMLKKEYNEEQKRLRKQLSSKIIDEFENVGGVSDDGTAKQA